MAPFFLGDTEYDVYLGSIRQNVYVGSDLITGGSSWELTTEGTEQGGGSTTVATGTGLYGPFTPTSADCDSALLTCPVIQTQSRPTRTDFHEVFRVDTYTCASGGCPFTEGNVGGLTGNAGVGATEQRREVVTAATFSTGVQTINNPESPVEVTNNLYVDPETFTISFVDNSGTNIGLSTAADFVITAQPGASIAGARGLTFSRNYGFSTGSASDNSDVISTTFSDENRRIEWTGTMPASGGSATITFTGTAVERELLDFDLTWVDNTGTGLNIFTGATTVGAHPGDPLIFERQINAETGFGLGSDLTASASGTVITASVTAAGVVSISGTQPAAGGSSTITVGGSAVVVVETFGFTISPRSSGFGLYRLTEITGTATGTITYAWSVDGGVSPSSGSGETFTTSSGPSGLKTITCTATRGGVETTETTTTFIF